MKKKKKTENLSKTIRIPFAWNASLQSRQKERWKGRHDEDYENLRIRFSNDHPTGSIISIC